MKKALFSALFQRVVFRLIHSLDRGVFELVQNVNINILRSRDLAVTEPFLYHLIRYPVFITPRRKRVSKRMNGIRYILVLFAKPPPSVLYRICGIGEDILRSMRLTLEDSLQTVEERDIPPRRLRFRSGNEYPLSRIVHVAPLYGESLALAHSACEIEREQVLQAAAANVLLEIILLVSRQRQFLFALSLNFCLTSVCCL